MPFHWSKHASHILTVFPPWSEHDGYDRHALAVAQHRLGMHIPEVLTQFYYSWGRRRDMTRFRETLLDLDSLTVQSGALVFAEENQAVYQWGIPCERLEEADPPVSYALWPQDGQERLWQPSHAHLSDFLDYLTYGHALSGGSPHGGVARERVDEPYLHAIQPDWIAIELISSPMGMYPNPEARWRLYGMSGVVMDPMGQVWIAAQSQDTLDEVRQRLGLTWECEW